MKQVRRPAMIWNQEFSGIRNPVVLIFYRVIIDYSWQRFDTLFNT